MHLKSLLVSSLLTLSPLVHAAVVGNSTKRGLVYIPDPDYPSDDDIFLSRNNKNQLTWYYNYQASPSKGLASRPDIEFVPMLWGAPASKTDNSFLTTVTALVKGGANITHVMGFNEPDGTNDTGGSNFDPVLAAAAWIRVIEPLRKLGLKLVAPATTGSPAGFVWLRAFFDACAGGCTVDVMPIHWYGSFDGLASHLGEKRAAYPNVTTWFTEYAFANEKLDWTQDFFNTTAEYFDRLDYVERYSYFGSFRSSKSNVGPNAAMLDQDGQLTDIGSLYLGGNLTGRVPSLKTTGSPGKSATGSEGAAGKVGAMGGVAAVVALSVAASMMLL